MKLILCGYNWAGCKALDLLTGDNHEVFVYTHLAPYHTNDLIYYCKKKGINYTTEKLSLSNLPFRPDMICSIYYQYIIPIEVIDLVAGKIFNLHPSLLPQYRGCSSTSWALINGERTIGYTYHYIDKQIDTGRIILQKELGIEDFDTGISLYYKMMYEALKDFKTALNLVVEGYKGEIQIGTGEYYKRGAPNNCEIDRNWSIDKIDRFIRAMNYPPLPPAMFEGKEIRTLDNFLELI